MDKITACNYLLEHPELLKASDNEIVRALKAAGIVSRNTYWKDCNVPSLLAEASRGIRRCTTCGRPL